MKFEPVDYKRDSNITFTMRRWARKARPYITVVQAVFSGNYRDGSAGAADAHLINGAINTINGAWFPSAMILDFSDLVYEWENPHIQLQDLHSNPDKTMRFLISAPLLGLIASLTLSACNTTSTAEEKEVDGGRRHHQQELRVQRGVQHLGRSPRRLRGRTSST